MSGVGTWEPDAGGRDPDAAVLERLAALARRYGADAPSALGAEEARVLVWLMRVDAGRWEALGEELDDDALRALARFFTVAERDLPGWEAGERSPVVALVRVLKRRHAFDRELSRWIRAHTRNRFLPHGNVLDRL